MHMLPGMLGCRSRVLPHRVPRMVAGAAWLLLGIWGQHAQAVFDPAKVYREAPAVAAKFPDPLIEIATPAFVPGKQDFTSQQELLAFIESLARKSSDLSVRMLGNTPEGRAIPLLVFARSEKGVNAAAAGNGKPTVLIIGQLHGDEPAGSEAGLALAASLAGGALSSLLERVNVLIVPRANPDGAFHFMRGAKHIPDINRDHLLLSSPEGQGLARVFVEFDPDVVIDCHEFSVAQRWVEKFGGVQSQDVMIQYATVPNLPLALTDAAEKLFRRPMLKALAQDGYTSTWYYTTTYDLKDPRVSMGGVTPDTGRNIAGLRNAVSFLIESRGVQLGRAHYKRRVATHIAAVASVLESSARNAEALLALRRDLRREIASMAGRGEITVVGTAKAEKQALEFLDVQTGAVKQVEVDWRSALEIEAKLKRPRPFAYLLPATETRAARQLQLLGVTVYRLGADAALDGQRYVVTSAEEARKEDVRRRDEDAVAAVVKLVTKLESRQIQARAGDFYVPLDQSLANLIVAALEPEPQSSLASNRLLPVHSSRALREAWLPLFRLPERVSAPVTRWDGE
jgi:hypothetical protein